MDLNPITTPNNILTDCINGTIITQDGNEYLLQNDFGNVKVDGAQLTPGYVPVGMKEYNGIIYIVSYNPVNNKTEVGSFPSIEFKNSSSSQTINSDININDISDNTLKYSDAINVYKEGIYINNETGDNITVEAGDFINIQLNDINIPPYITINNFIKTDSGNNWAIIANDEAKIIEYSGTLCYNFTVLNSSIPLISNFLSTVKYNPDWSKKISIQTRSTQESNALIDLDIAVSVEYNTNINLANFIDNYKIKLSIYTVKENIETLATSSIIDSFTMTTKTFNSQNNTYEIRFPIDKENLPDFIRIKLEPYLEFEDHKFVFDNSIGIYDYNILIEDRTDSVYAFDKYQYYLEDNNWIVKFNTGYNLDTVKDLVYKYDILTGTVENSVAQTYSIYKDGDIDTLKIINSAEADKTITIPKTDLEDENIYILQLQINYNEKIETNVEDSNVEDSNTDTEESTEEPTEKPTEETEKWEAKTINIYRFLITSSYFRDKSHTSNYIDYSSIPLDIWAQKSDLISVNLPSEVENIQTTTYNNIDNWLVTTIRVVDPDKETVATDGNTYFKDKKDNFYKSITKTGDLKIEKVVNLDTDKNNIWSSNVTGDVNIELLEDDNIITSYKTTIESNEELKNSIEFYYEKYYELYSNEISESDKYYHRKYLYDDYCGEKLYLNGELLRKEELEGNIYEKYKSSLITDDIKEIKKRSLYLTTKLFEYTLEDDIVNHSMRIYWNSSARAYASTVKCFGDLFGSEFMFTTINDITLLELKSQYTHISYPLYSSYLLGFASELIQNKDNAISFNGQNYFENGLTKTSTFIPVVIDPSNFTSYIGIYNNDQLYSKDVKYAIIVHQYCETEEIDESGKYDVSTGFGNVKLLTINGQYLFDSIDQINNICRNLSTTHFIYNKDKYLVSPNKFRKFNIGNYKQEIVKNYNINKINLKIAIKSINFWGVSSQDIEFKFDMPLTNFNTTDNYNTLSFNNNALYSVDIEEFLITQNEYNQLNNSVNSSILNTKLSTTYSPTNYRDYDEYNLVLDSDSETIVNANIEFLNKNTAFTIVYSPSIDTMAIKFQNGNDTTNKVGLGVGIKRRYTNTIYWNGILYIAYNTKDNININTDSESICNKNNYTSISYMFMTSWDKLVNILTYENTSKYNIIK